MGSGLFVSATLIALNTLIALATRCPIFSV